LLVTSSVFLALTLTACTGAQIPTPTLGACPDITGSWESSKYDFLQVFLGNTHDIVKDTTMILQIDEQDGCLFSGSNIWSNGRIGGTETIAGSLNSDTGELIIVEVGNHPSGGSSGRMSGQHIGNRINLVYSGLGEHGDQADVFSTVLTNSIDPIAAARCPDISGVWNSDVYTVFNVFSDSKIIEANRLPMTLEIQEQQGCMFRALNTWTDGAIGGSEYIAGIIQPETGFITMLELDPHPESGSSARVWGRLVSSDEIHWTYVGRASDDLMGQAIHLTLSKSGISHERENCPDLLGTYGSPSPHEVLTVESNGSSRTHFTAHTSIEVTFQSGCRFSGFNHWTNNAGVVVSEVIAGVMDGESDMLHMIEIGPTPTGGSQGVFVDRLIAKKYLSQSYTGHATDNSYVQIYRVILEKE
jgi:hypothetical protein